MHKSDEIRIIGGTGKFEELLKVIADGKTTIVRYDSPEEAVNAESMECTAYFIMPHYERGEKFVPEMNFETIKKFAGLQQKGQKLFIENYMACDYLHSSVFGHQVDGLERHFFNEYLIADNELKADIDGYILQARNSYYYPGRAMGYHTDYGRKVLLSASDCIGTHNIFKEGSFSFPVLVRVFNFFASAMNMTEYDGTMMLPFFRWKEVYAFLFNEILDIEKVKVKAAFEKVFKPISVYGKSFNTLENVVEKAVKWHFNSGLMLDKDGTKGIYEMITSYNLKPRANIRMDSEMLTGVLLCKYGKIDNDKKLIKTGKNLIRFLLDNGIQVEKGEAAGLFKWFHDLGMGPHVIYSSDAGRGGLTMINMYKLFKDEEYLERSRKLGDAIIRWLGPEGLLCGNFNSRTGFSGRQSAEHVTDNPVYYGEMTSFMLQLYKHTGETKYKDAVLKYANKIMSKFPNTKPFGYSDNFTYSRYLLMLASVQELAGMDLSEKINDCLRFFKNLQHNSGGIRETPIRLTDHAEAGVGIGDSSDNIADMLYCNNFILCALSVICKMKNPHSIDLNLARDIYDKLRDFILAAQIKDSGPRFDGGWMRAFDMDHNEYYGLNKDKDWGAYCIMAGWITGFIPLALLNELGEDSFFI